MSQLRGDSIATVPTIDLARWVRTVVLGRALPPPPPPTLLAAPEDDSEALATPSVVMKMDIEGCVSW